ncbi:TOBE domain-containing protein [Rhizobium sp. NFR03]|nr:TOBE domain-containing protein [Rhizobium sp. NFR03]
MGRRNGDLAAMEGLQGKLSGRTAAANELDYPPVHRLRLAGYIEQSNSLIHAAKDRADRLRCRICLSAHLADAVDAFAEGAEGLHQPDQLRLVAAIARDRDVPLPAGQRIHAGREIDDPARGFTAVYVTHDQDEALAVSDRIIIMKDGVIAQEGSPRDLYEAPASAFIADFMGEANVVACDVIRVEGADATIRIGALEHRVPSRNARPGPAKLAVRPNSITLEPASSAALPGRITHAAYLGDHVEYEVETGTGRLFVVNPAVKRALPPATDVAVGFKGRGIAIIND